MKVQITKSTLGLDTSDFETFVSLWKGQKGTAVRAIGTGPVPHGYVVRMDSGKEVAVSRKYLARIRNEQKVEL